jgi:hypothetical protein
MPEPTLCCRAGGGYCDRCDLLVGLPGMHVIGVDRDPLDRLMGPTPGTWTQGVITRRSAA